MHRDFKGNMRPGQKNRGRGGRPNNMMGGGNPNNTARVRRTACRISTSSGPSVKIRGNAYQVFERYIAMAREAASAGDRVAAENLYQHAEHYYRIMQANGEGQQNQIGGQRPMTPADTEMTRMTRRRPQAARSSRCSRSTIAAHSTSSISRGSLSLSRSRNRSRSRIRPSRSPAAAEPAGPRRTRRNRRCRLPIPMQS